ncbi:sensor domain-containing diguanylate cyclase [Aeromonas bestiarum]|uniref:diguanylate cyclase n=1 Tax=Aeromonas bestiarum TaxID=105751 RepID=A0ABT7PZA6_9GAMM|nr:sensor domain-containing diguanylate cyclase [Aeromonas bestiarum]MDM5072189.1 sensor domain-containing diguanylate cyclase [Aeromonas bestiarum]
MLLPRFLKIDLRSLILALAVISVMATLSNSFYATYEAQRALLISNTLDANRVYAAKLAEMTNTMLQSSQSQLAYSATLLAPAMKDDSTLLSEMQRLQQQTATFNSVAVVNADAVVVAVYPDTLQVKGARLTSQSAKLSITTRQPVITDPFVSLSGNYLISISYPIFDKEQVYLGYVAGTIYLQSHNMLSGILGQHYYQDGSSLYVVDRNRTRIYHPDSTRVGEKIRDNGVVDKVLSGEEGALALTDETGTEMLAGFAPIPQTHWGVVAQRPRAATLAGLDQQMMHVLLKIIPINLLILLFIWISAIFISRPLWQLAHKAKLMDQQESLKNIARIRVWYFEAAQLKQAMLKGLGLLNTRITQLHNDSHTDAMTGLFNRRGMQQVLDSYQALGQPLAVIALDIDHFKQINDGFGHDVGDQVLAALAALMQQGARQADAVCRSGGEEFLVLLPGLPLPLAFEIAERLRQRVAAHPMPGAGHITISLGVAHWPGSDDDLNAVLKQADKALYEAKRRGRNRTVLASRDQQPVHDDGSQPLSPPEDPQKRGHPD